MRVFKTINLKGVKTLAQVEAYEPEDPCDTTGLLGEYMHAGMQAAIAQGRKRKTVDSAYRA